MAQSLIAAARTTRGQAPQSAHFYFLRAGRPDVELTLSVSRLSDAGRFANREVLGQQGGDVMLAALTAFHSGDHSPDWQRTIDLGPAPHTLASEPPPHLAGAVVVDNYDLRVDDRGLAAPDWDLELWVRHRDPLADDPMLHTAAVAYATDFGIARAARLHFATEDAFSTTLSHSLWFHRPTRADEWFKLSAHHESAADGRVLAQGAVHNQAGERVLSFAQEVLLRVPVRWGEED
jgi:acyl-CoA thioesterase II